MRLQPQTKKATEMMMDLGLITKDGTSAFYDAEGRLRSMADITDALHNATKDLTDEQKTQAFTTMFGTDAFRAAAVLAEHTGDEFRKMDDTMRNTSGADVAKRRMDNFKGSWEQLSGAIESLQIQVGTPFLPVLAAGIQWLADNLPKVPTWMWVTAGAVGVFIGALSALALALLPIAGLLSTIGGGSVAAGAAFMGTAALFAGGVAAIVGTLYLLIFQFDAVKKAANDARVAILDAVGAKEGGTVDAGLKGAGMGILTGLGPVGAFRALQQSWGDAKGAWNRLTTPEAGSRGEMSLEGFANGGTVPGPMGAPRLVVAHGGETITPPGRGGLNLTINMGGFIGGAADFQRAVLEALTVAQQRGMLPS